MQTVFPSGMRSTKSVRSDLVPRAHLINVRRRSVISMQVIPEGDTQLPVLEYGDDGVPIIG